MADSDIGFTPGARHISMRLLLSYALDWLALIVVAAIAALLGRIEPNKRPFSLVDPDISFPFTAHETVPPYLLLTLSAVIPICVIAIVSLVFVPGPTVPKDTPKALVWKRKLWELHVGWLGLALALISAWFFTEGMKNMYGKPRPDLLSRCEPDVEDAQKYVVGGYAGESINGQLFSADICQQKDSHKLNDGFRSYPSGHSSFSAAGLIYTSLFLASKFAVTIPFVVPASVSAGSTTHAAFPSRMHSEVDHYSVFASPSRCAPIYLLVITLMPFCVAVFVASSRWFDFRHHGFDILFGFLMGTITSIYAFRYYHLPIQEGAGWAWGHRSEDRAFWAGVGRLGYVGDAGNLPEQSESHHQDLGAPLTVTPSAFTQRPVNIDHDDHESRQFPSLELQRIGSRDYLEERSIYG
ncbi:hypothetical protein MRS44_017081 [Fusarium solani]|uniref:uncharacterized protein n=1 Tax=Fusarium solani TaxID=169388 RepID=UPI0032C48CC1|nr:hypothetical protein MRS44_017081 [Fusarium solani]